MKNFAAEKRKRAKQKLKGKERTPVRVPFWYANSIKKYSMV